VRFPGLDGLRAVAILLVIAWHGALRVNLPPWAMGPFKPFIYVGWAGVDLFFALSGFLITSLLLREEALDAAGGGPGRFRLSWFYARRALRILPPFFFVLVLNLVLFSATRFFASAQLPRVPPTAMESLSLATFWSNYYYTYAGVTAPGPAFLVLWSLCVEEHFYLMWPFLLTLVRGRRARLAIGFSVCALAAAARLLAARHHLDSAAAIHMLSHYRIDSILWGALGALLFDLLRLHRRASRTALALGVGASAWLFLTGALGPTMTPLGHSLGLTVLASTSTLLVMEAAAGGSPLLRVLGLRPLREVGRVSYGMYLLHFQAIDVGARLVLTRASQPSVAAFAVLYALFVAIAFAAAWLMYRLVEKPFLDHSGRFRPPALASSGS
jgi:peptidoglycan/LPS O-acetylase OafA/YrhL